MATLVAVTIFLGQSIRTWETLEAPRKVLYVYMHEYVYRVQRHLQLVSSPVWMPGTEHICECLEGQSQAIVSCPCECHCPNFQQYTLWQHVNKKSRQHTASQMDKGLFACFIYTHIYCSREKQANKAVVYIFHGQLQQQELDFSPEDVQARIKSHILQIFRATRSYLKQVKIWKECISLQAGAQLAWKMGALGPLRCG